MNYYLTTLFAAATISAIVFFLVMKKKDSQGAVPLAVLLVGVFIWALFQALVFLVSGFENKLIMANVRYFGIVSSSLAFYALAREYEDKKKLFSLKQWVWLSAFPVICLIMLWTDQIHHLFYARTVYENGHLNLVNGLFFYGNMVYLYAFIILGLLIFIKASIDKTSVYRKQALLLASSAGIPMIANILFVADIWPYKTIDITPLTFLISASLFFYGLFYYKLLDIIPIAKESLLEEMEDFVIVLDLKMRVLDLNRKAREFFYKMYRGPFDYVGKEAKDCAIGWSQLREVIYNPNLTSEKISYVEGEKTQYFHVRISSLHDKKGNHSGFLIMLRDVTELEEALQESQRAKSEAERANKAKDFFLANMSHEIRTPLNAVIGVAEILESSELPKERQKEYITVILNSAVSLLGILNDILDFSKIEAGKMDLEMSSFNLKKLALEMVDIFSINATNKSIVLKTEIEEDVEDFFIGDSTRVRQIFSNLLGNAIKFTENGTVTIFIEKQGEENGKALIKIAVEDTGIGIPDESQDRIFESFRQADSTTTRKYGGTGLGLSIVKNLVELMEGEIVIESEIGRGSTFTCFIPFEVDYKRVELKEEEKVPESFNLEELLIELSVLRILVAEDNKVNRDIIGMQLKRVGCSFEFAENGKLAFEKAREGQYDLILMDVMMPELDGLSATKEIRSGKRTRDIELLSLP